MRIQEYRCYRHSQKPLSKRFTNLSRRVKVVRKREIRCGIAARPAFSTKEADTQMYALCPRTPL